jgi:hypothetical protein
MERYHIYIFDYSIGAIYYKSTDDIDRNKTNAINDDGTWDFEVLITELGFNLNNIEYLVSEEPLEIIYL